MWVLLKAVKKRVNRRCYSFALVCLYDNYCDYFNNPKGGQDECGRVYTMLDNGDMRNKRSVFIY